VKANISGDSRSYFDGVHVTPLNDERWFGPGQVRLVNVELRSLIALAYGIPESARRFTVVGDDRVLSTRYDVAVAAPALGTINLTMFRTLLADRFQFRAHFETRPAAVFRVVRASKGLGPQLRPTSVDCTTFLKALALDADTPEPRGHDGERLCVGDHVSGGTLRLRAASPISGLLFRLQGFVDRPLIDATTLLGNYEWEVSFMLVGALADTAPELNTALQDQLGLKLIPVTVRLPCW
jgi:uncharacterized protein (TIGR03435 family)